MTAGLPPHTDDPRPVRILWVTENHPPSRGGMAQSSDRIVRHLRALGATVDVAHLIRSSEHRRGMRRVSGGIDFRLPLGDDPEHGLHRAWLDIAGAMPVDSGHSRRTDLNTDARGRPEPSCTHVVAFGGAFPMLAAPVWAAWLGAPLVTMLRGNDFDTGLFSPRRRGALLDALRASSAVFVVASQNVDRVRALIPGTAVHFVANGIDTTEWEPTPTELANAEAWRAATVTPDRVAIGIVGHLKAKKGTIFFLDALRKTPGSERAHAVLVGEIDDEVRTWIDRHGGQVSATLLPFLDRYELLSVLPALDWVAVPSFYDGMPNIALEAAAIGVPVIASDAGGLADLARDGVVARSFAAADPHQLRRLLHEVLAMAAGDRVALGAGSASQVKASCTAGAEAGRYLEVLSSIAQTAAP